MTAYHRQLLETQDVEVVVAYYFTVFLGELRTSPKRVVTPGSTCADHTPVTFRT
jgi:hypothetical protein